MNTRLLLVEPSATMRYVLEDYTQSLGYEVETVDDYHVARDALNEQFRAFEGDYAAVLLGWPAVPDEKADDLASLLDQDAFSDLPVVVLSTDMRSSTRAWVAGRESTSLLSWKEYQSIENQLTSMLATRVSGGSQSNPKFDNTDIHLLLVDDSISIRHALRDLFELQGYRVSLAATHDEALDLARREQMDLAILDFYLQEGTGDVLCRELTHDPATGNMICAMLTGTYSDHIIKRSLRAGAIECMFKNESSELILSRVDALSRFIRQRDALQKSRGSLDRVVDSLAGATLLLSSQYKVNYASPKALSLLNQATDENLIDRSIADFIDTKQFSVDSKDWQDVVWMMSAEQSHPLQVRNQALAHANETLLFLQAGQLSESRSDAVDAVSLESMESYPLAKMFLQRLGEYQMSKDTADHAVSLLLIEVDNHDRSLRAEDYELLEQALLDLYKFPGHLARLAENRYGVLLRHVSASQSYLMTRKLMQLCNDVQLPEHGQVLETTASLISLGENAAFSSAELLQRAFVGLDGISQRGSNVALLLDVKKVLPVYPANGAR